MGKGNRINIYLSDEQKVLLDKISVLADNSAFEVNYSKIFHEGLRKAFLDLQRLQPRKRGQKQ